jgi:hypothetical protein
MQANYTDAQLEEIVRRVLHRFQTITTSKTLKGYPFSYLIDASAGSVTVTLPTVISPDMPLFLKRVDSSANTVTIAAPSGKTIEGAASITLTATPKGAVQLLYRDPTWYILTKV